MKRVRFLWAAAFAGVLLSPMAKGQDVFTVGFEGPDNISAGAGQKKTATYYATVKHEGTGNNAQGWSYGVTQEPNAVILSITSDGTLGAPADKGGLQSGGFEATQVVDPERNGGMTGAVSAVVLSFQTKVTLPPLSTSRVGKMDVEFTVPAAGGATKLFFTDLLKGPGVAVKTVVTQDGKTKTPIQAAKPISLTPAVNCCGADVIVGFSGELIRGPSKAEDPRIAGLGTDCLATGGTIDVFSALGVTGAKTVYANISNNLVDTKVAVQGWSFSIRSVGDAQIIGVTSSGTAGGLVADGGLQAGGFESTGLTVPEKNPDGRVGAVSAVVLSFQTPIILPLGGTESVLKLDVKASQPQGETPENLELRFEEGLSGPGQPVKNVVTVGGKSKDACNEKFASVTVAFKKSEVAPERSFIRGNANNDLKVDIGDAIWIINAIFREGPRGTCDDALDVNDDGSADATDAVSLIDYLFKGDDSPSSPFPSCGPDTTEDTLTCEVEQTAC